MNPSKNLFSLNFTATLFVCLALFHNLFAASLADVSQKNPGKHPLRVNPKGPAGFPASLYGGKTATPLNKKSGFGALFKSASNHVDTLEVFVMYVEFKEDDDPNTTGTGRFSTADDTVAIDPLENTQYRYYLDKHFEFANNYYREVSKGQLYIKHRPFKKPVDGLVEPYQLERSIAQYNPIALKKDEKLREFQERQATSYMTFVKDVVETVNRESDPENNPFLIPEPTSPNVHRAYLIFHAGHSQLVDGGLMGNLNADSPADFIDFFITANDFRFLEEFTESTPEDSLGVPVQGGELISELMILSESASQDGLNWGINGILVNQIGQQIGMPNTYDVVRGISQMGYFDVMDFAGYNTLQGFLPVYPSAWVREYMGWENPEYATIPDSGDFSPYQVWALQANGSPGKPTSLKVPLNSREYLLVENRQRALEDSVTVYFHNQINPDDKTYGQLDSVRFAFARADSFLLDSMCVKWKANKTCDEKQPNPDQPKGIITGSSSYDLGLPGSGLLVWHVNQWVVEQFIKFRAANAYLGDTVQSQLLGVTLVEADGNLSLGKRFQDPLGQDAFDFGTPQDMLPHTSKHLEDPPGDSIWSNDTINLISPYGYASTRSWTDGQTHITIEAPLPTEAKIDTGISSFTGDSVFTYRDSSLLVRVYRPDNKVLQVKPGARWPIPTLPMSGPRTLVLGDQGAAKILMAVDDSGLPLVYDANGSPAVKPSDTIKVPVHYDSLVTLVRDSSQADTVSIPVPSLGGDLGVLKGIGLAALDSRTAVLATETGLHFLRIVPGFIPSDSVDSDSVYSAASASVVIEAGPLVAQEKAWIITTNNQLMSFDFSATAIDTISLPDADYQNLASWTHSGITYVGASASGGSIVVVNPQNADPQKDKFSAYNPDWNGLNISEAETFSISATDFNRDNSTDVLLLGSLGSTVILHAHGAQAGEVFANFPIRFPRSIVIADTSGKSYTTSDPSLPALSDLDDDGYPEFVFTAANQVYAVNYKGVPVDGWPYNLNPNRPVGFLHSSEIYPHSVLNSTPMILQMDGKTVILTGSPDGVVVAVDGSGKEIKTSSFKEEQKNRMGVVSLTTSDWPLSVGGPNLDTTDYPFVHLHLSDMDGEDDLELLAQTGTGSIRLWSLKQAEAAVGKYWNTVGGNQSRTQFLDVSDLDAPASETIVKTIHEFFLFPSPVTGPRATVFLDIGAPAEKARVRIFDLAGNEVAAHSWESLISGEQPREQSIILNHLGPDVYTAQVEVWFEGEKKVKWERFGVIR